MTPGTMTFRDFDASAFLRDYWQQKPLLIRNPWAHWVNPLDPDDLAGLACEEGVEARLVTGTGRKWKVEHGPLAETRFATLGKKNWTLLVQAVDHVVPEVAALLAPFRFLPNWRIDDVMVSYATDGGGVGPHFDQYDVFLIQGLGRRRWRVGGLCDTNSALLPHDDLRLLAEFEAVDDWVLDPGDILYLPPRIAHDGVAVGDDCMTYSVGFRAPARSELIAHWCDHLLGILPDDDRYTDPAMTPQANPGEIAPATLDRLHAMITDALSDRQAFAKWFGEYTSTPKYPDAVEALEDEDEAEIRDRLSKGTPVVRNPASRFVFVRSDAGSIELFVDGTPYECIGEVAVFAERLCAEERIAFDPSQEITDATIALIARLLNNGSIAFED